MSPDSLHGWFGCYYALQTSTKNFLFLPSWHLAYWRQNNARMCICIQIIVLTTINLDLQKIQPIWRIESSGRVVSFRVTDQLHHERVTRKRTSLVHNRSMRDKCQLKPFHGQKKIGLCGNFKLRTYKFHPAATFVLKNLESNGHQVNSFWTVFTDFGR